ncbi:MAG: outer membrane beta-barrel protein [Spirochaetia bacterium]
MMRKTMVLVLVVMLVPAFAFGLELTLGVRAGLGHFDAWGSDYADLLDDVDASRDFSLGYTGGIYGSFALIDTLAIQPEIWLTGGGYSLSGDLDRSFRATTLETPILGKLRFGIGPASVVGFLGPNFRFKVSDFEQELDGDSSDISEDDLKSAVIGSVLGAGAELNVGVGILSADLRYYLDFTPWDDSSADLNVKEQSARLTVGFGFPIL